MEILLKDSAIVEDASGTQWLVHPKRDVFLLEGNYSDCSRQIDFPTGMKLSRATLSVEGSCKMPRVAIRFPRQALCEYILDSPESPLSQEKSVSVVFAMGLPNGGYRPMDLRKLQCGDVVWGFTIEDYSPGDKLIIEYRLCREIKLIDDDS